MQFLAILLFLTPAGVEQFQTTLPAPLADRLVWALQRRSLHRAASRGGVAANIQFPARQSTRIAEV